jgi:hypothetical protein
MAGVAETYKDLLAAYHRMIRREPWWDGRRDRLVTDRMVPLWRRMSASERAAAFAYAEQLYQESIR